MSVFCYKQTADTFSCSSSLSCPEENIYISSPKYVHKAASVGIVLSNFPDLSKTYKSYSFGLRWYAA